MKELEKHNDYGKQAFIEGAKWALGQVEIEPEQEVIHFTDETKWIQSAVDFNRAVSALTSKKTEILNSLEREICQHRKQLKK